MRARYAGLRLPPHVIGLIEEARTAQLESRHEVARTRYEGALRRLGHPRHAALAGALLRWIGQTYKAVGDFEAARDCYEASLAVARACDATAETAQGLNSIAVLMFDLGHLDEATERYEHARALAERAGDWKLVAMVDQNLGNVANIHGDFELARSRFYRSLLLYRALGLEEYVGPLLNNIGRLHTDTGRFEAAETKFREALVSCERAGNATYRVLIEVNRARLRVANGEIEAARRACDAALELSLQLGNRLWLGEIHKQSGIVFRRSSRPRLAEESFQRALREAKRRQELLLEAEITEEMAQLYHSEARHREMLECLNRAHDVFAQLHARPALADVDRQIRQLEASFLQIVREWGDSIESKDLYTQGHCERVADHACALARVAGFEGGWLTWFRMGALLHDLGKVSVPSAILNKPGPLTEEEWAVMRSHPQSGVDLLADVDFPWDIRPMILHHHERWDGHGYPHGLSGEEIPLAARILCVADVFDALTTTRSYREPFSPDVALEIMAGDAGHVFDPRLFEAFREVVAPEPPAAPRVWRTFRRDQRGLGLFGRRPPLPTVA